ncbi:hypothetical protein TraAM80_07001 [Trypanosoma rangeli]|uniref:Uncharacterized protein n=1 Tax=Trypanosoma rangeli TaxID=5698 RepID=A0A422N7M3_TRYRA|nr:uncharacterized protein TraAM80_07001 [Trypanosoma rangeli]RNF01460.1 hypothetical protein TraAM80_07001 [Trypanosoma rangeli]|eukprot:RNF01460.1 hypothetical protein TraAM80_07001 [Trypanosoma rangeli]
MLCLSLFDLTLCVPAAAGEKTKGTGETGMLDGASSSRNTAFLASEGHYASAQEADEARRRQMEEERRRRQQELHVQQEIEWKSFQDARERCRKDAHLSAMMDKIQFRGALHSNYSRLCKAHEEEMQAYLTRIEAEQARRSVRLAPTYRETQANASRLTGTGLYAEPAQLKAMTLCLEGDVHNATAENNRQLVGWKLREKQKELETRSLASYRNVFDAQLLGQRRSGEKRRAVEANLQHKASEMAVSHYNERRALYLPLLSTRNSSKTQQLRVSRGTQLMQRVNGDHYYVPSLCNLYGSLLEQG